jgi:ABC-type antimicrobial peptide transport system permease subunit
VDETKHQNNLVMKADDGLNSDYVISMENSDFNDGISEKNLKEIQAVGGVKEVCPVKHFMGATLINESQYTNKHFFDSTNKMKRLKKYFNGICTKEENGNYLIKGNLYGYDNLMIQKLNDYLIDGSLDMKRMDEKGEVIVCLPEDGGTGKYDTIKIQPGDKIRIKVPKSINVTADMLKFQGENDWYEIKEFKVAATVKRVMAHNDYFIGPYGLDIIMSNSMMEKEFLIDNYNIISIEKEKGADGALVADKILKIINNIKRCTFIDYTSLVEKENMNLNQRQIFFTGLSAVIALISMFHIINSINYLIISRKQDFGILRAIGLSDRSFIQMMMREGLLYGVYASALMIIGTVIVNTIIFYFIKKVGLYLSPRYTVNWMNMLLYIVINCGLSMMAVLISVRNILKKEIIDCVNKID